MDIYKEHRPIEEGEGSEVGGTSGESFALCLQGPHPTDCGQDVGIWDQDGRHCGNSNQGRKEEQDDVGYRGVWAGQLEHWGDVTEEVINDVGTTVGQDEDIPCLQSWNEHPHSIGAHHQLGAQALGHDGVVEERVADGHKSVIGHDGQEQALPCTVEDHEGHLDHTAREWDGLVHSEEAGQQPGGEHGGIANVQKGEHTQEEVHGGVEGRAGTDQVYHAQVAHQSHSVDQQEDAKEEMFLVGLVCEAQQDESCHRGVILPWCHSTGVLYTGQWPRGGETGMLTFSSNR